jgi:hypothetical protein
VRKRSVWNRRIGASCALVLCLLVAPATNVWAAPPTDDVAAADSSGGNGNSDEAHAKNDERKGDDGGSTASASATAGASIPQATDHSAKNGPKHAPDPDPTPQASDQATKGPLECPGYDQEQGGAYDHDNCDGSQGLHGNGGNGKCAGCTGKADDKSPNGQYPGDHNNGYECDHNSGVGKGNPAHSKCSSSPPTCTQNCNPCTVNCNPCTQNCNPCTVNCNPCVVNCNPCVGDDCDPEEVCPAGTDLAGTPMDEVDSCNVPDDLCPAGTDMAGRPPGPDGCNEDEVLPRVITKDPDDRVLGKRLSVLPFTGGNAANFVTWALLMITAGALLLLPSAVMRRRGMSHQK